MTTTEEHDTEPIDVAELVRRTPRQLSRYRKKTPARVKLTGRLADVDTIAGNHAWLVIRAINGLEKNEIAMATIPNPSTETDRLLQKIGRNGRITLVGMANTGNPKIATIRMTDVHTINGERVLEEELTIACC